MDLPYYVGKEMNVFFRDVNDTRACDCLLSIKEHLMFPLQPLLLVVQAIVAVMEI